MATSRLSLSFDERKVDQVFASLNQCHLPGASVGVAIEGRPVYRKGFGLASFEQPLVLTPSTRMRIQSTSKHFTCLAFMLLCEEGRAAIDDPIGKYLPEVHPVAREVTMRQLMTHTSGLRDAFGLRYQFSGMSRDVSTEDLVALYQRIDDVNFKPGTSWSYCNGGYAMLCVAIERISGTSLEEVKRQRIFEPAGMHDTLLRRYDAVLIPNSASNHVLSTLGKFHCPPALGASAGSGGVASTIDDMLRWLAHMSAPIVGSRQTWDLMTTPQRLENGTSTGYGLGLMMSSYRGARTLWHAGGVLGSNSQMLKLLDVPLDLEIMVNRHDISAVSLAYQVVDACIDGLEPPREAHSFPMPGGIFCSPATGRVIQFGTSQGSSWIPEGQTIVSINGYDMPVQFDGQGVLRPVQMVDFLKVAIVTDPKTGPPRRLRFEYFGTLDELSEIPSTDEADATDVTGVYSSPTASIRAEVAGSGSQVRLFTVGPFGSSDFDLQRLAERIWRARSTAQIPLGGILTFDGDYRGFSFSDFSTRALSFHRVT